MFKINVPNKCSVFLLTNTRSDDIVFIEYMFGIVVRCIWHIQPFNILSGEEHRRNYYEYSSR